MNTTARFLAVLALGSALGAALPGCAPRQYAIAEGDSSLAFYVRNEMDRDVVILVDGTEQLRVASGQRVADQQVILPARQAYAIEARTTTGHLLGSFRTDTVDWLGAPGLVKNLRCGDIWVWVGHDIRVREVAPLPLDQQEPCD